MTCYQTTCLNNCCNAYGQCPESYNTLYFDTSYTSCYTYYNGVNVGTIVGAVIGGIVAIVIIIALVCHFKKRKDM